MTSRSATAPPSGTVAMLFTDIEGSTRLAQSLPDAYDELLQRHRSVLRAAFANHDGYEVGTDGDSFFVTFASPREAVAAAAEGQRVLATEAWPADARVRVRMGLHVGEVAMVDGDYVGVEVHRAARIASIGHGGQVLVSDAAAAVIGDRLPDGLSLEDAGEYELKDFDAPVRIHLLVGDGLEASATVLSARSARRGHLPERRASFIGRGQELDALSRAIATNRLVTLTGPGGTGKTSLALEVTQRVADDYPDGAWFVELASLIEPEYLVATIHRVLGAAEDPSRPPLESLSNYLSDRQVLLLLDNMEQLLPAAAGTVDDLLRRTKGLEILVTSREPLHLAGEQQFPVAPLQVPADDDAAHDNGGNEAVRLFLDRARAVEPAFDLTDANRAAVHGLVRRLDGLPLAIELAAARVKLLEPREILEVLSAGSGELSGAATLPERQRTLREAIGWSHRLLTDTERVLFARLAVFAGGCTLEAVEAVCNPDGQLGRVTLDTLGSLVDKSLLRRVRSELGSRFEMLATIRDYAHQQLAGLDPDGTTAKRHAHFMTDLAESAAPDLTRPGELRARIGLEIDNLRAAMTWAIATDDAEVGARLCGGLWRFWHLRALLNEGLDWAERLLRIAPDATMTAARVRALYGAGSLAYWHRDRQRAEDWYRAGLAGAIELGDRRLEADGVVNLLYLFSVFGEPGRPGEMAEIDARLLAIGRELDEPLYVAQADFATAGRLMAQGKLEEARERAENTLRIVEESGDIFMAASANNIAGGIAYAQGDLAGAIRRDKEAVELFYSLGDEIALTMSTRAMASMAAEAGSPEVGARLAGFAERLVRDTGIRFKPPFEPPDAMELARTAIGDARAEAEQEAGRLLTREEAIDLVRSIQPPPQDPT